MVQSREEALGSVEKLVQHAKTLEKKYSDKVNSGLDCVFSFRQETKTAGKCKREGETCRASHAKGELKLVHVYFSPFILPASVFYHR